jgi:hypothetical protein
MVNITAIVVVVATITGLALFSMPVSQQASAACEVKDNPGNGATVTKCPRESIPGGTVQCHEVKTHSGNDNESCHLKTQ